MSTEYDKTMATEQERDQGADASVMPGREGCDRGTGTSVTFAEQNREPGNTVRECDSEPVLAVTCATTGRSNRVVAA